MKHRILGKIISAIILAVAVNSVFYLTSVHRAEIGREAFLARETTRYDHTAVSPSFAHYLIPILVMLGLTFLLYEIVAFAICKILDKMFDEKVNA